MSTLTEKVMLSCGLSEQEANRELQCATDVLMSSEVTLNTIDDFCTSLGLDDEDLMENPEALLAFM